jgi:hypothetical protein
MTVILNNININCTPAKEIINLRDVVYTGNIPVVDLIAPLLNGTRYHISINQKPTLEFNTDFIRIFNSLLDDIQELMNRSEYLLARNTSDKIFESCTSYWHSLILNGKHSLAKEFWIGILNIVDTWEELNQVEIHKGSPYFFLAHNCLLLDDVENTFIFLSRAIREDERVCSQFNQDYRGAPGYKTISLSNDRNNFMYYKVQEIRSYLDEGLNNYNRKLRKGLSFQTIEKKFFQDTKYVEPMIFFNFIINILKIQEDSLEHLENDFSKVRILNLIFSLCLVIDKILWIRFSKKFPYMRGNIKELCKVKKWCSKKYIGNVMHNEVSEKIGSDKVTEFEDIINALLDYKLEYKGNKVKREVQTMLLLWGLRNQGAHKLEKQNILIRRYREITLYLLNAFFMSTY